MVETLRLSDVIIAETWVFEDAGCSDVIPLFTTPTKATDDVFEDVSMRLLYDPTLMQGAAIERGCRYGARVLEWVASCTETPDGDWLFFLRP
jgi:hypothetical protein